MTKRLSYEEIKARVEKHGFSLVTTRQEWEERHRDRVMVTSPDGYLQGRTTDSFCPGRPQVICQFGKLGRKGQTLAVLAASELLGVPVLQEQIPPVPGARRFLLDGLAELRRPDGTLAILALEHQGDHRNNPRAPINLVKGDVEQAMSQQQQRDAELAALLKLDPRVVLVLVPDLLLSAKTEFKMIQIVADCLEEGLAWLKCDEAYLQRKSLLLGKAQSGERALPIPASWSAREVARVKKSLQASGHEETLSVVSVDPLARTVTLDCKIHGRLEPVNINNVLGSASTGRRGTRCRHCADQANGASRRLSVDRITQLAKEVGFRPLFEPHEYLGNQTVLRWQCLRIPEHVVEDTWAHIVERGCPHCRAEQRSTSRRDGEFEQIRAIVGERGDALLSDVEDYVDQRSLIRFRCVHCGGESHQMASKVKHGYQHGCRRIALAKEGRRANEHQKLTHLLSGMGLELLTTPSEYEGNRSKVRYRRKGVNDEVLTAPVYRLREMARRAAGKPAE